jgi:hypothetical protein
MRDFQHISQSVRPFEGHGRSPLAVGRVDANPLFGRDSMADIDWTCAKTAVDATTHKASAKTSEGDSNTESEVAGA